MAGWWDIPSYTNTPWSPVSMNGNFMDAFFHDCYNASTISDFFNPLTHFQCGLQILWEKGDFKVWLVAAVLAYLITVTVISTVKTLMRTLYYVLKNALVLVTVIGIIWTVANYTDLLPLGVSTSTTMPKSHTEL